jgi:serine phosphatase RsbU (regulator of sigma subunit)
VAAIMVGTVNRTPGGPLARLRAARRDAPMFVAPESPRGRRLALVALMALTVGIYFLSTAAGYHVAPSLTLVVPVVLGGFLLQRRPLELLLAVVAVAYFTEAGVKGWDGTRPGALVVLVVVGAIALELARDRERLGLSTGRGESILLELRNQLRRQGEMPPLPAGWHSDVAQRSAGGTAFGGDFIVSALGDRGRLLELAIVDVSGKGLDAGTRSLMLAGALGGLLGAVPPERFLSAANDYLLRQELEEGFATSLHVTIDLSTGAYRLTTAGHPPAAHYSGGSGRWRLVEIDGDLLGVLPGATFGVAEGVLAPRDALLLYTDGLIEVPGRDLAVGIDRLLGAAELLVPRGFDRGAQTIVEAVAPTGSDDRAVVLLWRR